MEFHTLLSLGDTSMNGAGEKEQEKCTATLRIILNKPSEMPENMPHPILVLTDLKDLPNTSR
jgi:hypothetical protein